MKKLKNYFKAFTLVELIIVITILAILATISFISFKNFTSNARDGNRVATVTQIEKGLNLIQLKTGKYPQPDGEILTGALLLSGSELVYSSMGIIEENISRLIKMNTIPLDPVSNSKYVYAVNNKQDTYQIATLLESLEANRKLPLIEQTYANENYKAKVVGNHQVNVKVPKDDKIWLTTVPSMIFHPEGSNILNSSGTYHIINGGQNIPYKINDKTITTKETGDKIIQHIRKSQDAKIITVDITDIVKASNETTRKAKIEEIFGTGNTQESKEFLASIGAITGSEETINTTILTQTVESIITGGSVGSASSYTAPKTPAICGTANKTYENTANSFGTDIFCDVGTLDGENPTFPSQGNSVNWTCISPDEGVNASCSATKLNPNEEIKECSGKPANSKYYNSSDAHEVTVNFGSPAPTPNYAETPSENSCDFSCNEGYGYNNGNCEGNSYTVTFDSQGGNAITSKNVIYGNTYGTLTSPTRTGYTFNGWFTATSGGTQVTESTNVTSTSNHTLYAQWTATQYTVTLNADGGSGGSISVTATYGSAMPSITLPTKSGCTFNGYFTNTNGAGTQYYTSGGASARSYDIASNTTLYANWGCSNITAFIRTQGQNSGYEIIFIRLGNQESINIGTTHLSRATAYNQWCQSKGYNGGICSPGYLSPGCVPASNQRGHNRMYNNGNRYTILERNGITSSFNTSRVWFHHVNQANTDGSGYAHPTVHNSRFNDNGTTVGHSTNGQRDTDNYSGHSLIPGPTRTLLAGDWVACGR